MGKGFDAVAKVTIGASRAAVWEALTDPTKIKQYMHGTNVVTDWKVGGPIAWKGEWKGKAYVDKGTVVAFEPGKRLSHTYWSSMGGTEDKPENYNTVTYRLTGRGRKMVLTLTQDNNETQEAADAMAKNNWGPVLEGLKGIAEKDSAGT